MALRGQAFDTMMLVISVIVALAILAVLLNIIGNITGIGQGDPSSLMHTQLKNMVTAGYGCSSPQTTTITRGSSIFAKQIQGDIASIQSTDKLEFSVDPSLSNNGGIVGTSGDFSGSSTQGSLKASGLSSQSAQIVFVVCANTQATPNQIFNICVGPTTSSSTITGCSPQSQ